MMSSFGCLAEIRPSFNLTLSLCEHLQPVQTSTRSSTNVPCSDLHHRKHTDPNNTMSSTMGDQPSLPVLHDRMDALWASYLQYLDNYTKAQALVQKHMSAGFLSLARANFNARDGVTRYGKDFYHERAVATKRVSMNTDASPNGSARLEFIEWEVPVGSDEPLDEEDENDADGARNDTVQREDESEKTQQPSPPATPKPEVTSAQQCSEKPSSEKQTKDADPQPTKSKSPLESDPLRWFGILLPRDLRSAKSSFQFAVNEPMTDAVNAMRSMRGVEVELRKLRKEVRRMERS